MQIYVFMLHETLKVSGLVESKYVDVILENIALVMVNHVAHLSVFFIYYYFLFPLLLFPFCYRFDLTGCVKLKYIQLSFLWLKYSKMSLAVTVSFSILKKIH